MSERWFMARCPECPAPLPIPFSNRGERSDWMLAHYKGTGHAADLYEEPQRYRQTYMTTIDPSSKATVMVCGHLDCERFARVITVSCQLGGVVSAQDLLNAIDAHYKEKHNDE